LTLAALLIVLAVAGIQLANPHSYVSEAVGRIAEAGPVPMPASPIWRTSISWRLTHARCWLTDL
jgi:hypothetical protein